MHGVVDAVAIGSKTGPVPWAFAGLLVAARIRGRHWVGAELSRPAGYTSAGEAPDASPDEPPTPWRRTFTAALALWLGTAVVAVAVAAAGTGLEGVVVATAGGAAFGVVSAIRVDNWRQRARRRRTRPDDANELGGHDADLTRPS
jgi:hypothetical protein